MGARAADDASTRRRSRFNVQLPADRKQKMAGARIDWQLSPQTRLMVRGNYGIEVTPNFGGGSDHPSNATENKRHNDEIYSTLTQVLGNRGLNEIRGGFSSFYYYNYSMVRWPGHPMAASQGVTIGTAAHHVHRVHGRPGAPTTRSGWDRTSGRFATTSPTRSTPGDVTT